ncbi:MAG: type II toxin-antitoxin system VapC family toxin [Deltaproteobacteria bacterium]|nr:type II toxin-antitoxin system VapC family toxin [Deltaproteobacteria bacterium]
MKKVFADSHYWIALAKPRDQWEKAAKAARELLGEALIVTTDEVLTEFLAALSSVKYLRQLAAKMVRSILENPNVKVIPQTRDSFLKGLTFYERQNDKQYSLIDCISMNVMKNESLVEVLTNDSHFEQEGYTMIVISSRKGILF